MNESTSHFSYIGSQGRAKMMKKCIGVEQTLKHYLECWHLQDQRCHFRMKKKSQNVDDYSEK